MKHNTTIHGTSELLHGIDRRGTGEVLIKSFFAETFNISETHQNPPTAPHGSPEPSYCVTRTLLMHPMTHKNPPTAPPWLTRSNFPTFPWLTKTLLLHPHGSQEPSYCIPWLTRLNPPTAPPWLTRTILLHPHGSPD